MSKYYGLHPLIVKQLEAECLFEDFTVWSRSVDGTWADLFDPQERIHIEVWIDPLPGAVFAQVVATVHGFGGAIKGVSLCLPNQHLHTEVMQLLTILEFLPREDNINDHTHKVHLRWVQKDRERRKKVEEEIYISLQEDLVMLPDTEVARYLRDLCADNGISLADKTYLDLLAEADSLLRRAARKIRKNREGG